MFIIRRIWCRVFQQVFHAAIPLLPYRSPKRVQTVGAIPEICRQHNVASVMIVTDAGDTQERQSRPKLRPGSGGAFYCMDPGDE
ncbi:MAG: hypothetical protein MR868_12220 [Lachnospiraceae bacterium]|nr:hypothetical protein [Lachnospiraceae bacterium]